MLYFTIQNRLQDGTSKVPEAAGARWRFYRRIIVGYPRIVFLLAEALQGVSAQILSFKISWQAQYLVRLEGDFTCSAHWKWRFICRADHRWRSFCVPGAVFGEVGGWLYLLHALEMTFHMSRRSSMTFILRGRRSIWWCWRVTLLAPRIGNDVSYVTQISDDIHFAWQAQYLVRLAGDFSWQAQHFVTFWEIAGARNVDMLYFTIQNRLQDGTSKVPEAAGARWRFYRWISSNRLSIGGSNSGIFRWHVDLIISWQAQYLVRLEGDFACSTHWKWRFICDADHWWPSFCVAGAVFGEVRVGLFVAGAALRDILGDSRSAKCCILQYKIVSKMGRVRSPKRRVRDDDFIVGLSSDILESSFYWRKHFKEFPLKSWASRFRGRRSIWWGWRVTLLAPRIGNDVSYVAQIIDDVHFACQAQYLVRLEGDSTCSTHWKWRFICRADHRWRSFCVPGAVFGDVGGWLYLLHALEMTFHMWRRSVMTFILRGRRSIWWCWRVTLLAPRIGNDVSKKYRSSTL